MLILLFSSSWPNLQVPIIHEKQQEHRRGDGLKKKTEKTFPEPFDETQGEYRGVLEEGLKKESNHLELQ